MTASPARYAVADPFTNNQPVTPNTTMKYKYAFIALALAIFAPLQGQVPQLINYQGRVAVNTMNFDGSGQFKFALVDAAGTATFWSNDGTSIAGSQPTAAVTLTVSKGLYSVLLGDATLANMVILPSTVFTNTDVRLRVWFNDGTHGFQLLTPDQRIAAVGYAMMAGSVPDGAITGAKIAAGAVDSSHLSTNVMGSFSPPGVVVAYAGLTAPTGWAMCDGSEVSRTTFASLFAAIGTSHGTGDGSTTFNLPDYRGRFLRGVDGGTGRDTDAASRTPMATGGSAGASVGSVQQDALKAHNHVVTLLNPEGVGPGVAAGKNNTTGTTNTATTGGSETRPKNAAVNFIIKL
jgi:microcystin-dependent protein